MRAPLLGLWVLWLAAPGAARAQATASSTQAAAGPGQAADPGKPAPQLLDAARRHYEDAIRFYQEGRYDAARIEFEASFALSREPDLLYNLSTTAEKQGQTADAIRYAERYLEAKPNAEDAEKVRERIARLRAPQQTSVPDVVPPAAPPSPPVSSALPAPAPPADALTVPRRSVPAPALALLGGGAALLLGGIGTGAGALVTAQDIEGRMTIGYAELRDLESRGQALDAAAISLSVIGGAAVVVGGAWLGAALARRSASR